MPEEFTDTPGLRDGSRRTIRRLGLEDFADRPQAGLSEMGLECRQDARDHAYHGSCWFLRLQAPRFPRSKLSGSVTGAQDEAMLDVLYTSYQVFFSPLLIQLGL